MISENPNPSGYTFYPEKKVFIYYFTLYAAFLLFAVSSLLAGILAVLQVEHSFVYAYSIAFFILLYLFINRWVGYKKTSYQILEDRLVQNLGGLFYQNCSELLLKNITHIGMSRAFPEYQLFGTSRIFADAAGRSNQEIVFIAIANGESIEESILEKMRVKGFSLKKENLQAQLKQQWTGILWDSLSLFLYVLFIIGVLALNIIFDENLKNANFHALIILCAVLGTLLFLYCLYYFFLNRSALYSIYEDTLVEEKNFFNFYRTQMPMENLTDVSLKQNLIKVLLGLYDVVVSCEGVGKEFYIPNIREGENIRALLGTLIVKAKDQQKNEEENSQAEITAPESSSIITGSLSKPVFQESLPNSSSSENTIPSFTFELAMFPKRVYFLAFFFLALTLLYTLGIILAFFVWNHFQWIFLLGEILFILFTSLLFLYGYIRLKSNRFLVDTKSFVHHFHFITTKITEFTVEKTTGIVIFRGILDRLLGSCTLRFDSIGNQDSLYFTMIPFDKEKIEKILLKKGFTKNPPMGSISSDYSFLAFLIAQPAWIFLLPLAPFAYLGYYRFYYSKMVLDYHSSFFHFHRGWIWLEEYYVPYEEVKFCQGIRYPIVTRRGNLTIDYAGEYLVSSGQDKISVTNNFTIEMVSHPFDLSIATNRVLAGLWKVEKAFQYLEEASYESVQLEEIMDSKPIREARAHYWTIMGPLLIIPAFILIVLPFLHMGITQFIKGESLTLWGALSDMSPLYVFSSLAVLPLLYFHLYLRRLYFFLTPHEVIRQDGVIYIRQSSVLYERIDNLTKYRGLFHHIFRTGRIEISTKGSSAVELIIGPLREFEDFYEDLHKFYKSEKA